MPSISVHSNEYDPYRSFVENTGLLIEMARFASRDDNQSYSYRGFRVGASGLFFRDADPEFKLFSAGNLKAKESSPKFCAEQRLIRRAEKKKFTHVAGIVVAATTNKELIKGVSEIPAPTLHPCGDCRFHMQHKKDMVSDDTLIVTTGFDHDRYQVHRFGELRRLHDEFEAEALINERIADSYPDWGRCVKKYDLLVRRSADEVTIRASLAQVALLGAVEIY